MSNELVVIEEGKALTILSQPEGVDKLVAEVRDRVMSLEGGNLETGVGRKQIKSNAFKATKAKTAINEQHIQPLIDSITKKIQPDLDTIDALKDNRKRLNAGLDQIRKDVNAEVQAIEDEIKRKEEEEKARIAAEKLREEVERDHEMALLMNAEFDRQLAERMAEEARIEKERQAQIEKERLEREEQLKREAAEAARLEAERIAKEEADRIEREKQEAIEREAEAKRQAEQAERDRIAAEERAKAQAEEAERQRKLAEEKAKRDAEEAAERAKQAEIQRQKDEEARLAAEQAKREANRKHIGKIRKEAKESLMAVGLNEEQAKAVVMAIHEKRIANVQINY